MRNNILWGNTSTNGAEDLIYPDIVNPFDACCNIIGSGTTNFLATDKASNLFGANPMLVNTNSGDYRLATNSPCLAGAVQLSGTMFCKITITVLFWVSLIVTAFDFIFF